MDNDEFMWAYGISRSDNPAAEPIAYFYRLKHAKDELKILEERYPEIPFEIVVPGTQLYVQKGAHEEVH